MHNQYISSLENYFEDHKYNIDQSIIGIRWMIQEIRRRKPRTYLEIGAASLYTYELIATELASPALAMGIDIHPNRDDWFTYKPLGNYDHLLIHGSSIDPNTVDQIKDKLAGKTIDCLFLDGNHYKEFVFKEWELYSPLVTNPGGMVFLHDCEPTVGLDLLRSGKEDTSGQGAGMLFNVLKDQGYDVSLVPGSTIGTGFVVL